MISYLKKQTKILRAMTRGIILMRTTTQLTSYSNLIHKGDHIIGVYPNKEIELDLAFEFLKDGLQRNETVMLVTEALSKTEIRKKMKTIFKVDVDNLEHYKSAIIWCGSDMLEQVLHLTLLLLPLQLPVQSLI